jgi:hypothetical protein
LASTTTVRRSGVSGCSTDLRYDRSERLLASIAAVI